MWPDVGRRWPWLWQVLPIRLALAKPLPARRRQEKASLLASDDARLRRRELAEALRREFERLLMMIHS